ncbi:MAG: hypothetical protein FWH18_04330 [Marinilabiliaceae bacterium]|nr:hypothetical protein [Marinilabiliaceae bacterium]
MELTKSQKRIARELIDIGLQRECKSFGLKIAKFTNSSDWDAKPHDIYLKLFEKVVSFDKHISRRYDFLGGSRTSIQFGNYLWMEYLKRKILLLLTTMLKIG